MTVTLQSVWQWRYSLYDSDVTVCMTVTLECMTVTLESVWQWRYSLYDSDVTVCMMVMSAELKAGTEAEVMSACFCSSSSDEQNK